jgi:hypothetical protein
MRYSNIFLTFDINSDPDASPAKAFFIKLEHSPSMRAETKAGGVVEYIRTLSKVDWPLCDWRCFSLLSHVLSRMRLILVVVVEESKLPTYLGTFFKPKSTSKVTVASSEVCTGLRW